MGQSGSDSRPSLSRGTKDLPAISRRRLIGAGGATALGLLLAGRGGLAAAAAAQGAGGAEFHGAWPYLVPPSGHFNLLEGVTNAVLGSASGGPFSPYADMVLSPMALYYWKTGEWLPLLAEKWSFTPEANEFTVTL